MSVCEPVSRSIPCGFGPAGCMTCRWITPRDSAVCGKQCRIQEHVRCILTGLSVCMHMLDDTSLSRLRLPALYFHVLSLGCCIGAVKRQSTQMLDRGHPAICIGCDRQLESGGLATDFQEALSDGGAQLPAIGAFDRLQHAVRGGSAEEDSPSGSIWRALIATHWQAAAEVVR